MGSIRGIKKKKKTEENDYQNALATSLQSQPKPLDWWEEFSRRITGPLSQSVHSMTFESVFKISRKTFNYVCSLVKEDMLSRSSNLMDISGEQLSLGDQVAVALRRLSSGESLSIVGDSFGINRTTVSQITWRFVEAMEERGFHHLLWPSTEMETKEIKSKFENIRGLPNCCGAIDITHIMMTLPTAHSSDNVWLDQEKNCSMILQAIVDPDLRFRDIVTGWPGSLSDDIVLQSSNFFKLTKEGNRLNGSHIALSDGTMLKEYIVGDAGFPLLPWLLTPYEGKSLSDHEQLKFNKLHVATRMVAKRALARLKELWRIIEGVMWKPDKNKLPRIIFVCCLLHNIVIDMEDEVQYDMSLSHDHDSGYHQQTSKFADKTASIMRDKLSLHLSEKLLP